MGNSTHTYAESAIQKDIDARIRWIVERFDEMDAKPEPIDVALINLNIMTTLALIMSVTLLQRLTALEENQKAILEILERIENSTNRQFGF